MGGGETIHFQGVTVVAESELALCCQIIGRDYWIAPSRVLAGSSVAHFGDRGVLVLARDIATEHGMVPDRRRPL
jgi:hypothetical protein